MNKQKIISLIKSSISLVKSFNPSLPLQPQANPLLNDPLKITLQDLHLFPVINKHAIGIRNIFQNPQLRLTVYFLQEGKVMKLHDHNEMHVVSKVISGRMEAKLYKPVDKENNIYEKTVKVYDTQGIYYIDGNRSYNLHEFTALEPTYFLDIIFPDYTYENGCNFYKEKGILEGNKVILEKVHDIDIIFEDI